MKGYDAIQMFEIDTRVLELCVLIAIDKEDTYGYKLTQELSDEFNISESTVYPVLRRLQKSNYLATYNKSIDGRNRRYYTLTDDGKKELEKQLESWSKYKNKVDNFIMKSKEGRDD